MAIESYEPDERCGARCNCSECEVDFPDSAADKTSRETPIGPRKSSRFLGDPFALLALSLPETACAPERVADLRRRMEALHGEYATSGGGAELKAGKRIVRLRRFVYRYPAKVLAGVSLWATGRHVVARLRAQALAGKAEAE